MSGIAVHTIVARSSLIFLAISSSLLAQEADIVSGGYAKGIAVLSATFPNRGQVHSFALEISTDGETFVSAHAGPVRGLRFAGKPVLGLNGRQSATIFLPVVGRFAQGNEGFLFEEPGRYWIRWDIAFRDRKADDFKMVQTVDVQPAVPVDLELLAKIGDDRFLADVLGLGAPEGGPSDLLALGFIAELLRHAQDDPGEEGSVGGKPDWADPCMSLAKEYPESSYAPYLAYYAARLYLKDLGRVTGSAGISPGLKKEPLYLKVADALQFSITHGDPFLAPRALCSLAFANALAASWTEAAGFLTQASERSAGQGAVLGFVEE